uniref:Uncharacterized protein n=1 Tax=Bactrocera dorsalis TaxID=27457 RepID=A0A034WVY7_BACDO
MVQVHPPFATTTFCIYIQYTYEYVYINTAHAKTYKVCIWNTNNLTQHPYGIYGSGSLGAVDVDSIAFVVSVDVAAELEDTLAPLLTLLPRRLLCNCCCCCWNTIAPPADM